MARRRTTPASLTPQAKLNAAIKSARDVMRKDAGLNGDLDRIPQLAWLLFLKAFDALEQQREVTERDFRPAIEEPYRWRDWAADPEGPTGPELIDLVNDELLPHLRSLVGTDEHDPRDTLAAVFKETYNRMLSGYLLRDVVDQVEKVNFASSDDIHTMAHLYESMLREVRDAAGDSGEFYTPRPVIRFVVQQIAPQLGEIVLDPACGTGGFLVEALEELRPQVESVEQWRELQAGLRGIEKKPLPYLLGTMNLLLHGMERPEIVRDNALAYPVTQIRRADKVDVVVTNPPFGGEEERVIQTNFPDATRTAETALLFVQLIQRRLNDGGRCGMVVPNGFLFGDGVAARVKERLLTECNVHTIVRLPSGVFAPYTDIPTNLLFFEKTGRTREVWFYEIGPPEGRKKYSKTRPMRFEEFGECQNWWGRPARDGREESKRAWRVPLGEIEADGWNLDRKNPHREELAHRPPEELISELIETEREIICLLEEIGGALVGLTSAEGPSVPIGKVLSRAERPIAVEPAREYQLLGIRSHGAGPFDAGVRNGGETSYKKLCLVRKNDFVFPKLMAWEGAFAVVPEEMDGFFVSPEFCVFESDPEQVDIAYFSQLFRVPTTWQHVAGRSIGTNVRRRRLYPDDFLAREIHLPALAEQKRIAALLGKLDAASKQQQLQRERIESLRLAVMSRALAGSP